MPHLNTKSEIENIGDAYKMAGKLFHLVWFDRLLGIRNSGDSGGGNMITGLMQTAWVTE
jgi:hypothetical protein